MANQPRRATSRLRSMSSRCQISLLAAALLLGAAAGRAGAQSTGSITGTVTDAATSTPLPNVTVHSYNASGAHVGSTVTDTSGAYAIADLPAGTYYLATVNGLEYADEFTATWRA